MNIRLVAEKVETYDDFHRTRRWATPISRAIFSAGPKYLRAKTFRRTR
jgi:hypothetical protein